MSIKGETSLTRLALTASAAALTAFAMTGCEEESSTGNAGAGSPEEGPKSVLGKSAQYAKDTIADAEARDANAVGTAGAITGSEAVRIGDLAFYLPANWKLGGPDGMAQATAISPRGEATVMFYAGIGGGVEANIDRWTNQVTLAGAPVTPRRDERDNSGIATTLIASEGNYTGMSGSTEYNWALRAAVIEGPRGDVMAKLVGPEEVIDRLDREWRALINSVQSDR